MAIMTFHLPTRSMTLHFLASITSVSACLVQLGAGPTREMGSIWGVADISCFKEMESTLTRLPRDATSQYLNGEQVLRRITVYPCAFICSPLLLIVCERV